MHRYANAIAASLLAITPALASPSTLLFTKGVNGNTNIRDVSVYEKKTDWNRFYYGDSYILANEQG